MRVVDIRQPFASTLFEARASETSDPIPYRDWIIVQAMGADALPAAELMRRNAEKFANMISARIMGPQAPVDAVPPAD
jgi:hypothetical protein